MTFSLPFGVLRSYYRSATTQMLSILDTGMNAPTHSTLNDGKHTWMGKPQYNPECGWTLYQWTLANSYGKSIVSPLGDQMVTVCWKKYCMIPVYKEGNILFYILNKIVLTRYTPKKVHRKWLLKALTTITWHCIFFPIMPFFSSKFQLPLSHINKKLIYRLNPNKAEPRGLCRLFPHHFETNYPLL